MDVKVKPCPFCGEEGAVVRAGEWLLGVKHIVYIPYCTNMQCFLNFNDVGFETAEEAIEAWNRRGKDGR